MERILFLDGSPSMKPLELTVGKNVQEMIQSDLDLELGAVKDYNAAIQVAVAEKDNGSRDLFVELLKDEEDHVDWLEAQVHQIKDDQERTRAAADLLTRGRDRTAEMRRWTEPAPPRTPRRRESRR